MAQSQFNPTQLPVNLAIICTDYVSARHRYLENSHKPKSQECVSAKASSESLSRVLTIGLGLFGQGIGGTSYFALSDMLDVETAELPAGAVYQDKMFDLVESTIAAFLQRLEQNAIDNEAKSKQMAEAMASVTVEG